jgi:GTPase Era involved in 16S rRNA processing
MSETEIMVHQTSPINFIDYDKTRINSLAALKRLRNIAKAVELEPSVIELIDKALERNERHKFSIAVVGEFKRGKSTFINALLGKEVLPADIAPCSATLNRVTYGLTPAVTIVYRGNEREDGGVEEISIDQLVNYVTKLTPESEIKAANVKEAIVRYPLAYCKNNVDIVDTPGLNDDAAMTQVTLSVLPDVSAAILVVMATAPFGATEADFLTNQLLVQDLGRIIFVVTGIDLIRNKADRERIKNVISDRIRTSVNRRLLEQFGSETSEDYQRIRRQIGADFPKVFGISGYQALVAKEENDRQLLTESGFEEFEESLERFITETRGAIELQVLANRTIAACNEISRKLGTEMGALQMEQAEFDAAYESAITELAALCKRRDEEIQAIAEAAENTQQRIQPLIKQLPDELKRAAAALVEETEMSVADIKKPAFIDALGRKIANAIQVATKRNSEKIQMEVERDLVNEIDRLGNFAAKVNQVLYDIEMQFVQADSSSQSGAMARDAMAVVVGGLTGTIWGGVMAGYQEAGGKGAAVGGATSFGAFMAGSVAIVALSIPVTWPVVIGLGVATTLAGKLAARFAFQGQRIERFRQEYTEQVIGQIEGHLAKQNPDVEVNKHIDKAYATLKEQLVGELDASINQTQSTLEKLRNQKARQETRIEHKRKENEQLLLEVQGNRDRAQALSSQLVDIKMV